MGLSSIGRFFDRKKEKKSTPPTPASALANQLYQEASEAEKEEIRQQYRSPVAEGNTDLEYERRSATFRVPEGPHMEALVRRELLMRAEETRRDLLKTGGKALSFLKNPQETDPEQLERHLTVQKEARSIAKKLLKGRSRTLLHNVLATLQSLNEGETLDTLPNETAGFFALAEQYLKQYNQQMKTDIPFKVLKGQLYFVLQRSIQTRRTPDRYTNYIIPADKTLEALSPQEATSFADKEIKKRKRAA